MSRVASTLLALLLVLSAVATPLAVGSVEAAPQGMVGVPDDNISEDLPADYSGSLGADDLRGRTLASTNASTLDVIVTTPERAKQHVDNGSILGGERTDTAIVLRDDVASDGRRVALDAEAMRTTLGYAPERVWGTADDGERWSAETEVVDGYLVFEVPHFSTQTVTFSSEVRLLGDPATTGTSYTYEVDNLDAATTPSWNLTGVTTQESETVVGDRLVDGDSLDVSIAGNLPPTNEQVTFTGVETRSEATTSVTSVSSGSSTSVTVGGNEPAEQANVTFTGSGSTSSGSVSATAVSDGSSKSYSIGGDLSPTSESVTFTGETTTSNGDQSFGEVSAGSSVSLSNPGNIEPTGPVGGEPRITVTGAPYSETTRYAGDDGEMLLMYPNRDYSRVSLHYYTPSEITVSELKVRYPGGQTGATISGFDVYISSGQDDQNWREGTQVVNEGSWTEPNNGDFTPVNRTHKLQDSATVSGHFEIEFLSDGSEGSLRTLRHTTSGNHYTDKGGSDNIFPSIWAVQSSNDISVAAGGSSANIGDLSPGETQSAALDLAANDGSLSVGGAGPVDVSIAKTDRTATENPSLDVDSDGTAEASHSGILTEGQTASTSVDLSTGSESVTARTDGGLVSYSMSWDERYATVDPAIDLDDDGTVEAQHNGVLGEGEQATVSVSGLDPSTSTIGWETSGQPFDATLRYQTVTHTEDPSIDLDDDGTADASVSGQLDPGQTSTSSVNLTAGDAPVVSTASGSSTGVSLAWDERTQTVDPTVSVNGISYTHDGSLAEGETVSLSGDRLDLVEGTNRVNVTVSPTTTTAAPTPSVVLNYSHRVETRYESNVTGSKFVETVNVTKTFPEDRDDVRVDVALADEAVEVVRVEQRVGGGSWSEVPETSRSFDGTNLTVDVGSVSAGEEVSVRATARQVAVYNGAIRVTQTTAESNDLDTAIEVVDAQEGFAIDVTGQDTDRLHYVTSTSWSADAHTVISSTGDERIDLPQAGAGSTFRVRTADLNVSPSGSIEAIVTDEEVPQFRLRKGDTGGSDRVEVTYYGGTDGEDLALYSITQDREVQAGEVDGGSIMWATDGRSATYEVRDANGSGGGSAVVSIGGDGDGSGDPLPILALVLGIGASIVATVVLGRRFGIEGRRATAMLLAVGGTLGLVGVEAVTSRSIVSDVTYALGGILGGFASSGAGAVLVGIGILLAIVLVRRWIGVPMWLVIVAGVLDAIYVVDALSGGVLTSTLSDLGPLVWLLLIGGSIALLWQALRGPTFEIVGRSSR